MSLRLQAASNAHLHYERLAYQLPFGEQGTRPTRASSRLSAKPIAESCDENWRSQVVTSNPSAKMGLRRPPYAFTQEGIAMLSSVLRLVEDIDRLGSKVEKIRSSEPPYTRRRIGDVTEND